MGMVPDRQPGDFERLIWGSVPHELEKLVVTLDRLREIFPKDETHNEVEQLEDFPKYVIYGRKIKKRMPETLAYGCKSCNEIVIGPPKIVDENSISSEHPLSGRIGYDVYCTKCNQSLKEVTEALS